MSHLEAPAFDLLEGKGPPHLGFGQPLPDSEARTEMLQTLIDDRRGRLQDAFGVDTSDSSDAPSKLDQILKQMWADHWSPKEGNVDLFATDFGLIVVDILLKQFGGTAMFRSENDLSHFSVWWPSRGVEAFPFHHTLKSLSSPDTETTTSFVYRVGRLLTDKTN